MASTVPTLTYSEAITNHYFLELTPEQRMDPRWDPDYRPTWDAFFINRDRKSVV